MTEVQKDPVSKFQTTHLSTKKIILGKTTKLNYSCALLTKLLQIWVDKKCS